MSTELLETSAKLVAAAAVVSMVAALGLGVTHRQLVSVLRRPGLLLRSVVAVLVLVPLAALLVALALGLERRVVIGIVLMGVSPAAPLVLKRAGDARGDTSFALGIQVVLAALSIASVPATLELLSRLFPASHVSVSPWEVAAQVGRAQGLPLAAGMLIRALRPAWADRLARPLMKLAMLLLALFVVAALTLRESALLHLGARAYVAMALAVGVSVGFGHLLGGPERETRAVLAVASAMRNPGLALLVVQLNFARQGIGDVLLAYVLVTCCFVAGYAAWRKRQRDASAGALPSA